MGKMNIPELPPLPAPDVYDVEDCHTYSEESMRAYGAACAAAEREAIAAYLDEEHRRIKHQHNYYACLAREIRERSNAKPAG
jgi:hypothetical protein